MITKGRIAQAALLAAFAVNIFLLLLVVDNNYGMLRFAAWSPYVRAVATITMIVCLVVAFAIQKLIQFDVLVIGLAAHLVFGIAIGLTREHSSYEFSRHVFAATTMLATYWCGVLLRGTALDGRLFRVMTVITALVGAATLVVSIPMMDGYGFSLSPGPTLVVLDSVLHRGSPLLLLLWLPLVIFGNRRAFLLAVAFIISVPITRRLLKGRTMPVQWAGAAAATVVLCATLLVGIHAASGFLVRTGFSSQAFERANRMAANILPQSSLTTSDAPMTGRTSKPPGEMSPLDKLTSGRLSQGRAVISAIGSSPIFGNGFGAQYTWEYWSDNLRSLQSFTLAQTDGLPFYFLLTNGIVGLAIPLLIAAALASLFTACLRSDIGIGSLFVLGFAVDMALSFQPNAHLFWLLLGFYSRLPTFTLNKISTNRLGNNANINQIGRSNLGS